MEMGCVESEWSKLSKAEIREQIVELIGEGAWQYAHYNYNINILIKESQSLHELAEKIQDLIANDFLQ